METGKIEFNIMDTGKAILTELKKLVELIEEQNLLIGTEEDCCPGCDGTCGEDE